MRKARLLFAVGLLAFSVLVPISTAKNCDGCWKTFTGTNCTGIAHDCYDD